MTPEEVYLEAWEQTKRQVQDSLDFIRSQGVLDLGDPQILSVAIQLASVQAINYNSLLLSMAVVQK